MAWTWAVLLTHRPKTTPLPNPSGTQPAPRAPWTGPGWSSVGVLRPVLLPSSQSGQLYSAHGLLPALPSMQGPLDTGQEAQGGVSERCIRARPSHFHPEPVSCAPARTMSQRPYQPPPQRLSSRLSNAGPWSWHPGSSRFPETLGLDSTRGSWCRWPVGGVSGTLPRAERHHLDPPPLSFPMAPAAAITLRDPLPRETDISSQGQAGREG